LITNSTYQSCITTVSVYVLCRREFTSWPEGYSVPEAAPDLSWRCWLF